MGLPKKVELSFFIGNRRIRFDKGADENDNEHY